MTRKLSTEEYEAFLADFGMENFRLQKLGDQSRLFRVAFLSFNFYSIAMISLYFVVVQLFSDSINQELVENGYVATLQTRSFVFLWMLFGFNTAFYFGVSFRLAASVILFYTLNVTFEHMLTLLSNYTFAEMPFLTPYILSRPVLMLFLAIAIFKYRKD